jgi:hypothetical protein
MSTPPGDNTPVQSTQTETCNPSVLFVDGTRFMLDNGADTSQLFPLDDAATSLWPPTKLPPLWWQGQIDFHLPLPKVSRCRDNIDIMFPPGSLFDPDELAWPPSPTTPFGFPFDPTSDQAFAGMVAELPDLPNTIDSVMHVVGLPRVCGLSGNSMTLVTIRSSGLAYDSTLVDTGANICVTGMLDLLVDVVVIPPLPILVAVHGAGVSLDDCCTHCGLLPLPLNDGSIYYQTCFYCKNIVETIISSQAIVAGSDLYVTWQQTGHRDVLPGCLHFFSDSGLASMSMVLKSVMASTMHQRMSSQSIGPLFTPLHLRFVVWSNPLRPPSVALHSVMSRSPD